MSDKSRRHVIADLRGGRNGVDPPWAIRDNECVDAVNVDWWRTTFAHKRGGMSASSTTFSSGGPFTGIISTLIRHVPGNDQTLAELWAVDDANVIGRMAASTTFTAPTMKDAATGNGWDYTSASINGKLMLAYKTAQARAHGYDPNASGGAQVKRLGLAAPGAPSVANTGSGSYAAVLRYYRVRVTVQVAGVTKYRSEASSSTSFTPSGSGTAARVTQGTLPGEGETHWELEASTDNSTFYRIATVAIGTTTSDDSAATTSYNTNPLSATTGFYTLWPSVKFMAADQNRLLGFGDYTSTNKQSRLYIGAVIGSSDIGDDERLDTTTNYYLDFDESDSGIPTGLAGPIYGSYFVFKDRQVWQLTPTGQPSLPYQQTAISKTSGALAHLAIARGEDANGNPALYWMSHRGPYRWTLSGLEYIGRNIEDYTITGNASINLTATNVVARTVYYPDKRQVWFWWATGTSADPNVGMIYDVLTGGWSRIPTTDLLANVRCVTMFSNTIGASMSLDLKPYVGQTGAVRRLWKCDAGATDNGTPFRAYVVTKAVEPGSAGFFGDMGDPLILAQAATGVKVTDTAIGNFGVFSASADADLTPTANGESRVSRRLMGLSFSDNLFFVQHQVGDAQATAGAWTIERIVVPYGKFGEATQ